MRGNQELDVKDRNVIFESLEVDGFRSLWPRLTPEAVAHAGVLRAVMYQRSMRSTQRDA